MLFGVVIAAVLESTTTPYPGVTYEVHVEESIPARIHVVQIDLSSQEIHLLATEAGQRGATACGYSSASGAQVVVNGDYFSAVGFQPAGLAMGGASVWADSDDDDANGFFRFDRNMDLNRASISPPEDVVGETDLPVGTLGVVGGRPMIVRAGIAQSSFDCADLVALPCERAPRTAVGLSSDGNTMWLVVVDGWQAGSLGMTAAELGAFASDRGAHDALLLDGGGSSTLCIDGVTESAPSDGVERPVANHLGVLHGSLPPGEMIGLVRECSIDNIGAELEGVTVELDDGQSQVTGADGRYDYANMTPRWACVTASKPGYIEKIQCRQVATGVVTFNSIALSPDEGCPSADAGPMVDAGPPVDARVEGPDSGTGAASDAGPDGDDVGNCACRIASKNRGTPLGLPLALCALAALLIRSKPGRS